MDLIGKWKVAKIRHGINKEYKKRKYKKNLIQTFVTIEWQKCLTKSFDIKSNWLYMQYLNKSFNRFVPKANSVYKSQCLCVSFNVCVCMCGCLSPLCNFLTEWNWPIIKYLFLAIFFLFIIMYHQTSCSCITKPPWIFNAGEAA